MLLPIVAYLTLTASGIGWDQWGGLQLNLFLTLAGVVFAFPLGILLALGRRSSLPVVKGISVTYIELIRGSPSSRCCYWGCLRLASSFRSSLRPSGVTRVLVAITLFEAAYIAEVVRGGFQAVPPGQTEAAASLGLSNLPDDANDRDAPGFASDHSGHGGTIHQFVQGHDLGCGRWLSRRPCGLRLCQHPVRLQCSGPGEDHLAVCRSGVLGGLLHHVPRGEEARATIGDRGEMTTPGHLLPTIP